MTNIHLGTTADSKKLNFPLESLKKHFIALGGSGSGKTILSKVIIEECSKKNIPSILIDPQGDLASLALGELDSNVVIFTPASSKGIPLCLNPLKKPSSSLDGEELISMTNQVVESLASLLGYKDDDASKAVKSLLYLVLHDAWSNNKDIGDFETLIDILRNLPQHIEDQIDSLFSSKKEIEKVVRKIKYLTIGEKELLFSLGVPLDIELLLKPGQISIIYLNSLTNQTEKDFFVSILAAELYQWMLSNPSKTLQAIFFIDEIAPYLPAGALKPLPKPILKLLYKQARKYGLGCLVATQNPGDIDYTAFAQFGSWAIGRLTTKQDRDKLMTSLSSVGGSKINKIKEILPSLKPGKFLLFSPDNFSNIVQFSVRQLITEHKTLNDNDVKKLTSAKMRKDFEQYTIKKTGAEHKPWTKGNITHFPLRINEEKALALTNKQKKKLFVLFGPENESIEKIELVLEPIIKSNVLMNKKRLIGRKKLKEYTILFNGISGNPMTATHKEFKGFSELVKISESELNLLKHLLKKNKASSSADLSYDLNISLNQTSSVMISLSKKKLITKAGNIQKASLWLPLVDFSIMNIKRISSLDLVIEEAPINGKKLNPIIEVKKISQVLNSWFGSCEIVDSELVYYPIYDITLTSKHKKRHLKLSGVTGKFI